MPRLGPIRLLAPLAALALLACSQGNAEPRDGSKAALGLFSTLPIYWGEGDLASMIGGDGEADWVRKTLEQRFTLEPLDALEPDMLAGIDRLVMAQPRPLAPSENVALDEWLRAGGRLLVFADPMLTRHSRYPIGDRRRPQDVVLLSPILKRWGLELTFDDAQAEGERWVEAFGGDFPVNLAGRFRQVEAGAPSECLVSDNGILAQCNVGKGRVTLLADAALLDSEEGDISGSRRRGAFDGLVGASLDF